MPNDPDYLTNASHLTAEHKARIASYRGRRVRVLRAIVYEGDGETIMDQLVRSLPVGIREAHGGKITITVVQGEVQDLGAQKQAAPETVTDLRALLDTAIRERDAARALARNFKNGSADIIDVQAAGDWLYGDDDCDGPDSGPLDC